MDGSSISAPVTNSTTTAANACSQQPPSASTACGVKPQQPGANDDQQQALERDDTGRGRGRGHPQQSGKKQQFSGRGGGGVKRGGRGGKKQSGNNNFTAVQEGAGRKRSKDEADAVEAARGRWDRKRTRIDDPDACHWGVNKEIRGDEIEREDRLPKRKAAVMVGYAGTGYKGMQISKTERTIEGDLFAAFIKAGAISKANADDPKKSQFVRCARTDKGVHAARNVVSLKLILEDHCVNSKDGERADEEKDKEKDSENNAAAVATAGGERGDLVARINAHLPPQIRVWGVQRTHKAFSCYKACDSRWYEYLMPSYCLLPPHPESFLARKLSESARNAGRLDEYTAAMEDVAGFWQDVDENRVKPLLAKMDRKTREAVMARMNSPEDFLAGHKSRSASPVAVVTPADRVDVDMTDAATDTQAQGRGQEQVQEQGSSGTDAKAKSVGGGTEKGTLTAVDFGYKAVKCEIVAAKREYRISEARLARLQKALDKYVGTHNYHNYTVNKAFKDRSASRLIRSFKVAEIPADVAAVAAGASARDTEADKRTQWLSLRVHGQSFMMHQIRKMVAMAVLCTRCATPLDRIDQSYAEAAISIPKAPGVGLLLDRPVFDHHNSRAAAMAIERDPIAFDKWSAEIETFKAEQIYKRIFEVEELDAPFHTFFNQLDHYETDYFLWLTMEGISEARLRKGFGADFETEVMLNVPGGDNDAGEAENDNDEES